MDKVCDDMRGLSRNIRRPVAFDSIASRNRYMKYGVAVASPQAAIMSAMVSIHTYKFYGKYTCTCWIKEGCDCRADSEAELLEPGKRYVTFIVWWWAIKD